MERWPDLMRVDKKFAGELAFIALVFLVMMVFFAEVHPIVLFDSDDWVGLSKQRNIAFPKWHDHNPIKVLPESLMPLAAPLAAYFVAPILGDFVSSITWVSAFFLSCFIAAYAYLFLKVMERNFGLEVWPACALTLIFLCFHFLIFRQGRFDSAYLFATPNLTNYYHYTIPALLNASLVLFFICRRIPGNLRLEGSRWKDALLVFALFLALCSSVLHNIIFMVYILVEFLWHIRRWREQGFYWKLLAAWCVVLLFEGLGGRAGQMSAGMSGMPVMETFLSLAHVFLQKNTGLFIGLAFLVIFLVISFFVYRGRREKDDLDAFYKESQQKMFLCAAIWVLYEVLVCAKAGGGYIDWPDVLIGLFFYLFFLMLSAVAYVFRRKPGALAILPILSFIVFCRTINAQQSLVESTVNRVPPAICARISRDIIAQVQAAEASGARKMELRVPKGNDVDNWPHTLYMGEAVSRLLYGQGLIPYPIEITIVPDPAMNEEYGMRKP